MLRGGRNGYRVTFAFLRTTPRRFDRMWSMRYFPHVLRGFDASGVQREYELILRVRGAVATTAKLRPPIQIAPTKRQNPRPQKKVALSFLELRRRSSQLARQQVQPSNGKPDPRITKTLPRKLTCLVATYTLVLCVGCPLLVAGCFFQMQGPSWVLRLEPKLHCRSVLLPTQRGKSKSTTSLANHNDMRVHG